MDWRGSCNLLLFSKQSPLSLFSLDLCSLSDLECEGEKLPWFWHRTCFYRQRVWLGAYRVQFELGGNSWCDSPQVDATRINWSSSEEWGSHRRSPWALMRLASGECDSHQIFLKSAICLLLPDFAWFLQSKNQNIAVPHSMDIQCKRHYLLVQNIDFCMETSRNNRSNNVISNSPKLNLCLSSSRDLNIGTGLDSKCKFPKCKNLHELFQLGTSRIMLV